MGLRRKKLKTRLAGSQQVSRGPEGPGAFPHKTSQITIFRKPPEGSLAKAWVSAETAASEVGDLEGNEAGIPPLPPPRPGFSPSPPSATIQHAPQGQRMEPLRKFGRWSIPLAFPYPR